MYLIVLERDDVVLANSAPDAPDTLRNLSGSINKIAADTPPEDAMINTIR
jgi:hypothetical protein